MPTIKVSKITHEPNEFSESFKKYLESKIKQTDRMTLEKETKRLRASYFLYKQRDEQTYEDSYEQVWLRYNNNNNDNFTFTYPTHKCESFREFVKKDRQANFEFRSLTRNTVTEYVVSRLKNDNDNKEIEIKVRIAKLKNIRSVYLTVNKYVSQMSTISLSPITYKAIRNLLELGANNHIKQCDDLLNEGLPLNKSNIKYIRSVKETFQESINIFRKRHDKILSILRDDAGLTQKMPYDMLNYISSFIGN
jgi:hypothetical protein